MSEPTSHIGKYEIASLFQLLRDQQGDSLILTLGSAPVLRTRQKQIAIEGSNLSEEILDQLLGELADSREMRGFRETRSLNQIHQFDGARFLVRAIRAFGEYRVELHAIRT